MTAAPPDEVHAPDEIGPPKLELHVGAEDAPHAALVPRLVRALVVGLMFSALPVVLTHFVLSGEEGAFDPRSTAAAIPVIAVSLWLSRPRGRWYAVGPRGFAQGERFFGDVRWDVTLFEDVERVVVEAHRAVDGTGDYRFTGYRIAFETGPRKRVVVEGQAEEAPPRGTEVRFPPDAELPEGHELRALRAAVEGWQASTGGAAEGADMLLARARGAS